MVRVAFSPSVMPPSVDRTPSSQPTVSRQLLGPAQLSKIRMPTLDDLLFSFEDSKCDDWQDKVYGLLGMIQGGGEFFVNYDEGRESLKSRALEHFSEIGRARLSSRDRADKRKRLNTALERVLGFETASVTNGNRLSLRNLRELALQESQTAN